MVVIKVNNFKTVMIFLSLSVLGTNGHKRLHQPLEELYLTPLIEKGDIEAAQRASKVVSVFDDPNVISYSGFLTVNKKYNSNLYFWFIQAENDCEKAPLTVWLHGGPGASSLYGLFETGPYYIDKTTGKLIKQKLPWTKFMNMLYIDNPIGTGFSFTDNDEGYSRSQIDIGENLYNAVKQFFQLFPKFAKNDFYLAGSSYAGKFIPALAYTIDEKQKTISDTDKINLKGLIIGNGFYDPAIGISRAEMLYQLGVIDLKFKKELQSYIDEIIVQINEGKFGEALDLNTNMRTILANKTAYSSLLDFRFPNDRYPYGDVQILFNRTDVRRKIHVGNVPFTANEKLFLYLRNEFMQTVKPWVETLIEKYRFLMYSGSLDLECSYISTVKLLQTLKWSSAEEYKNADRKIWYYDNEMTGYKKTAGKLTEVWIRDAGHNAYIDKHDAVYDLVKQFITNN